MPAEKREPRDLPETQTLLWEEEPVFSFPTPKIPLPVGAPRRVAAYYRRLEQMWQTRWEKTVYQRACAAAQEARAGSRPFNPWSARLTAAAVERDGLLGVRWEAEEQLGGRKAVLCRGEVWRLPRGTPITLKEFFPAGCPWKQQVLRQVEDQIRQRISSGAFSFWQDWPQRLVRSFDPDSFFWTEEGLQVFFPLCSIAPWLEGIPVFPIQISPENSQ